MQTFPTQASTTPIPSHPPRAPTSHSLHFHLNLPVCHVPGLDHPHIPLALHLPTPSVPYSHSKEVSHLPVVNLFPHLYSPLSILPRIGYHRPLIIFLLLPNLQCPLTPRHSGFSLVLHESGHPLPAPYSCLQPPVNLPPNRPCPSPTPSSYQVWTLPPPCSRLSLPPIRPQSNHPSPTLAPPATFNCFQPVFQAGFHSPHTSIQLLPYPTPVSHHHSVLSQ